MRPPACGLYWMGQPDKAIQAGYRPVRQGEAATEVDPGLTVGLGRRRRLYGRGFPLTEGTEETLMLPSRNQDACDNVEQGTSQRTHKT